MDKEDKELIPVKEGFFGKIKNFFKGLFKKKEEEKVSKEEIIVPKADNNFKDEIIISKDKEKERLLSLQEKFRRGELVKGDLSNEDIDKLSHLYDEQIEELKRKIMNDQMLAKKYLDKKLRKQAGM